MVNVTFTQSREIFDKFNVPRFKYCQRYFSKHFFFPFGLEFERTYYKRSESGLVAFRVLAYTIDDSDCLSKNLSFLVQLPNEAPRWITNFITKNTYVYDSPEDYIISGGSNTINLRWENLLNGGIGEFYQGKSDSYFFKHDTFYTIKNGAVCESDGYYCGNLFVSKHGWLVQIPNRSLEGYHGENGVYLSKADAMKILLKNMTICDFAEEPITIDITIMPNTPKYTKVMIVE